MQWIISFYSKEKKLRVPVSKLIFFDTRCAVLKDNGGAKRWIDYSEVKSFVPKF